MMAGRSHERLATTPTPDLSPAKTVGCFVLNILFFFLFFVIAFVSFLFLVVCKKQVLLKTV